jgi:hypothetical protein
MLSIRYTDGTNCDINSNKPRETVVFYGKNFPLYPSFNLPLLVCNENGNDGILNFQEVSSCYYEMTVTSSSLCSIPAFSPIVSNQHTINCYPQENALQKPKNLKKLEYERKLSSKAGNGAQFTVKKFLSFCIAQNVDL